MAGLKLSGIRKDFGQVRALDRVDLDLPGGKLTALLGPSGCGKTTLLRIIAGLEAASGGSLHLGSTDLTDVPAHKRKFGMVFQNFALFPHLNVRENVCYALTIAGMPKADAHARAAKLLDMVQLSAFADRKIGALSGGQRQRVAIARALAQEPEVFLLDEPMSALDANLREQMQVELRLLQQRLGITTIVVTHDQREAMTMADQIVVMSNGRVEQMGPPQEIYHQPANPFVADFIGKANFFEGVIEGGAFRNGDIRLELAPAAQFIDGADVKVAIRPEKAGIDDPEATDNTVTAKVTFVRDVGSTRDIHLDTPLGPMIVEYAIGENSSSFEVGATAELYLPATSLHVYPARERKAAA
ncbi:MAG: ABC transporter ATP-binding protein [Pseudomonadota bacterium]